MEGITMYSLLDALLVTVALCCLVPACVFFAQTIAGWATVRRWQYGWPRTRCKSVAGPDEVAASFAGHRPRASVAVLVPAHNEVQVLRKTLRCIQSQLGDADRLLVVADNCTDDTAGLARDLGAMVVERSDDCRRGKGYAVQAGLAALAEDPPEVVVFVDADCQLAPGCIRRLSKAASMTLRPVQGAYVMELPVRPTLRDRLSAFAVVTKNVLRPAGMEALGLPCLITGSGFAMPWHLTQAVTFDGRDLVEDMKISIELVLQGPGPKFCRSARLTAPLPGCQQAADRQRTRWEHGHLQTIRSQSPRLCAALLQRPRLRLLGMLFDLSVPPLSLLILMSLMGVGLQSCVLLAGLPIGIGRLALAMSIAALVSATAGCCIAWFTLGRQFIRWKDLVWAAPIYVLAKIPRFTQFFWRPEKQWIRTTR